MNKYRALHPDCQGMVNRWRPDRGPESLCNRSARWIVVAAGPSLGTVWCGNHAKQFHRDVLESIR